MGTQSRRSSVIYQVYPRSFQDSNGDGIGDLPGITSRLDHIAGLGVNAVWLSPIFTSPNADFGYDVSDYLNVDPVFGTNEDFTRLAERAHQLELLVLLDIVPCHTSIEHPWFRDHPDWYIWSPIDGPPNNWLSVFGDSAWQRDNASGRWYLHTYYKEQADLNWHNPEVAEAMTNVFSTWLDRGADGFRIDALQALFKDAQLRNNPTSEPIPPGQHHSALAEQIMTLNRPEIFPALKNLRTALPDAFLVAEAAVATSALPPYLDHVDISFSFEFLHAPLDTNELWRIINEAGRLRGIAWVLSNHDFPRLVSRWGEDTARVAALLLLTLPGAAFIYQGDEIGMTDGPGGDTTFDRIGRDSFRHPMQWDHNGGFTSGTPWLPMINSSKCNVESQANDPDSVLAYYKSLIAFREQLPVDEFEMLPLIGDVIQFRRGEFTVVINLGDHEATGPVDHGIVVFTSSTDATMSCLPPKTGIVIFNATPS